MEDGTKWESSWKRPENVPWPKVWHIFEAISKKTGRKYKIKIQDIPSDKFEESIDFTETNFNHCEPLCRATEIWNDSESVEEYRIVKRKSLEQKMSLMAVIDEENNANSKSEIVGILLLCVKSKNDPPKKQTGNTSNKISALFDHVWNGFDPFQLLESDRYISHQGVSVAPKYYGLGVGLELELQASVVGKAFGFKGSAIVFTSSYTQLFYEKLGCTLINKVRYDECKNENGEVIIPNMDGSAIFVIWKYT